MWFGKKNDKEASGSKDDNVLEVSVDKGYIKYLEDVKGDFEKENDVKVKLIERDMFEQLEALSLDGPVGKAPML